MNRSIIFLSFWNFYIFYEIISTKTRQQYKTKVLQYLKFFFFFKIPEMIKNNYQTYFYFKGIFFVLYSGIYHERFVK